MSLLLILFPKAKLQCVLNLKLKVEYDNNNDKSNSLSKALLLSRRKDLNLLNYTCR